MKTGRSSIKKTERKSIKSGKGWDLQYVEITNRDGSKREEWWGWELSAQNPSEQDYSVFATLAEGEAWAHRKQAKEKRK